MADTDSVALGNTSLAWITADGELCIRVGDKVATLDADQRLQLAALALRPSTEHDLAAVDVASTLRTLRDSIQSLQIIARQYDREDAASYDAPLAALGAVIVAIGSATRATQEGM